jgi:ferrochelatase
MAHGAPNAVEDIPPFLKNIRGGTESSAEVVEMVQERYRLIGGSSPQLEITQGQASALETYLNQSGADFKVYFGMRTWSPYIKDVVQQMLADGIQRVIAICLAPQYSTWSTKRYIKAFKESLDGSAADTGLDVRFVGSWADHPLLIDAFAEKYQQKVAALEAQGKDKIYTIFTVHSIPAGSVDEGDPYVEEYGRTLNALVEKVKPWRWFQAYQSQGMIPVPWLGPPVQNVLDKIARYGSRTVLVVPIGFVSDHIEILYDIDIDFKTYATERGLDLHRTESLNLSPLFTQALAAVAWEHMI